MDELAKFGHPMRGSSTCDLWRFGRFRGAQPSRIGDSIQGAVRRVRRRVALDQEGRLGDLLYQFDRRLADHGQLIFNIAPTKDGNRGLSIYAAFDYKKGQGFTGRVLWGVARVLFRDSCTTWCGIMPMHAQGGGRAKHTYAPTPAALDEGPRAPSMPIAVRSAMRGRQDSCRHHFTRGMGAVPRYSH